MLTMAQVSSWSVCSPHVLHTQPNPCCSAERSSAIRRVVWLRMPVLISTVQQSIRPRISNEPWATKVFPFSWYKSLCRPHQSRTFSASRVVPLEGTQSLRSSEIPPQCLWREDISAPYQSTRTCWEIEASTCWVWVSKWNNIRESNEWYSRSNTYIKLRSACLVVSELPPHWLLLR